MSPNAKRKYAGAVRCRRRFLGIFPDGFHDEEYLELERDYKFAAHLRWEEQLGKREMNRLIAAGEFAEVAARAVRIESRTNLLFSFEKMALRDAVRSPAGAERFATGLRDFLHGRGDVEDRFTSWVECVSMLPRFQTRVLTWPAVTVFGFLAQPETHFFLKPTVTRNAARAYGGELFYMSRPNWASYASLLGFVEDVRRDLRDLKPRDMLDLQGFLWVLGSDEYAD